MVAEMASSSAEHYTPVEYVEAARLTMGSIDCDPASCTEAQQVVNAKVWYSREDDGLAFNWRGSTLVNAPGTCWDGKTFYDCGDMLDSGKPRKVCTCHLPQKYWVHLAEQVLLGNVSQFVWVGFNAGHMRTLQSASKWLLEECCAFYPERRMRFNGDSPTKDNVILYCGDSVRRFKRFFRPMNGVFLRGMA